MEENNTSTPREQPGLSQNAQPSKRLNKKLLLIILSFLLVIAIVAGVYKWQNREVQNANSENEKIAAELRSLQEANLDNSSSPTSEPLPEPNAISKNLVPGQVDFDINNERGQPGVMYIEALVLPSDDLRELWLDYGTDISNLNLETEHTTKELGMGVDGTYGNFVFILIKKDLKPGIEYFYRVAAKKADGSVIRSGIASFNSLK